jgi:aryl-alcohol dehydrogenase-like predicted oxidoreductase
MKYRSVAKTNIRVSEVGFGLWGIATSQWRRFTESEATGLLQKAFSLGITLFETGDLFGNGISEELLGKALRNRRDDIVIATKVGYDIYDYARRNQVFRPRLREIPQIFSPEFIRYSVDQSLRRLQTDRIDFLELHNPGWHQVNDEYLWEVLDNLQREGKILHVGAALGPGFGWLYEGIDFIQRREPALLQLPYNLLEQYPGNRLFAAAYSKLPHSEAEAEDLPEFKHGRMNSDPAFRTSFLVRATHSNGFLDGSVTASTVFPASDPRSRRSNPALEQGLKKVEQLQFLTGRETGRTLGQSALLWLLAEPAVASCLPTIHNEEQLLEYTTASERNPLTRQELAHIQELYIAHFGLKEEKQKYKGTMARELARL